MIYPVENLQSEVIFIGDHHHYEPNSNVIKTFIQAPLLVTGPKALHPWLTAIAKKRDQSLKTIDARIDIKFSEIYQSKNTEVLAHFWLYPEIACDFLAQYQQKLKKNQIKINSVTENECLNKFKSNWNSLVLSAKKIKMPIVLTHDALIPLFKTLNLNVLALKGSNHHEEISPDAVKTLYKETKNTRLIWIQEDGFEIPVAIKRLIKNNDIIIKLDTNGKSGDDVADVIKKIALNLDKSI